MKRVLSLLGSLLLLLAALGLNKVAYAQTTDVLIYGATPAGIAAAVSATQEGKKVLILNPNKHIGGMMSGGLGASDVCQGRVIGGFSRNFFERIGAYYNQPLSWRFEPKIADKLFAQIISDHKLNIIFDSAVQSVETKKKKIISLTDQNKRRHQAKIFIDASYEGDLMAAAKLSYVVGRESRSEYAESSAGVFHLRVRDQFPLTVPARDAAGHLLPLVSSSPLEPEGTGDKKIMAYNYRPCITKDKSNQSPFPKPIDYDAKQFALLSEYFRLNPKSKLDEFIRPLDIPNSKYDLNNRGPVSTDFIGANYDYPEADAQKRTQIELQHRNYLLSLLYFLGNDTTVPEQVRSALATYGLCKDEFIESSNFPQQLYVREARRLRGVYVLSQNDLTHQAIKEDPIALASCPIESHHVQRVATNDGVKLEGWVSEKITPYQIPYRSTLPKKDQVQNMLVAVTLSATHIANSSLRMEPTYMIIGESLGVAAAIAINTSRPVQDVDIRELTKKLLARGQILSVPEKALKYAQAEVNLQRKRHARTQSQTK